MMPERRAPGGGIVPAPERGAAMRPRRGRAGLGVRRARGVRRASAPTGSARARAGRRRRAMSSPRWRAQRGGDARPLAGAPRRPARRAPTGRARSGRWRDGVRAGSGSRGCGGPRAASASASACSGASFSPAISTYSTVTSRPVLRGEARGGVDEVLRRGPRGSSGRAGGASRRRGRGARRRGGRPGRAPPGGRSWRAVPAVETVMRRGAEVHARRVAPEPDRGARAPAG